MKKAIAWPVAWSLYLLGDLASKLMHLCDRCHLYPVYHRLMSASIDVNDWGNVGLWQPALTSRIANLEPEDRQP